MDNNLTTPVEYGINDYNLNGGNVDMYLTFNINQKGEFVDFEEISIIGVAFPMDKFDFVDRFGYDALNDLEDFVIEIMEYDDFEFELDNFFQTQNPVIYDIVDV